VNEIFKYDAIHLSGGNTFYFLHLLRKRGLIDSLRAYVKDGGILIGISAGSIIMTNDISVAGLGEETDENIIGIEDKSALGLVNFEFLPHWDGSVEYLDLLKKYAKARNTMVYCCKDGDGIVINDNSIQLIGDIIKVEY
jgi:dipeptidase E